MNGIGVFPCMRLAIIALSAALFACILWRMGTAATVFLSLIALFAAVAAVTSSLLGAGARRRNRQEWAQPVATETQLRVLRVVAFHGLVGRAFWFVVAVLMFAVGLAMAFPGRMGAVPIQAAVLAIAVLALGGMVAAFMSERGWAFDTVVPDGHLRERLGGLGFWPRFRAGWSLTGRIAALREAAALHPDASPAAKALLMAQYAPQAVPLALLETRKSPADEIRLRLMGWPVVVTVAGLAALLSILLMLFVPQGIWDRMFPGMDLSELSPVASERSVLEEEDAPRDEKEEPEEGSTSGDNNGGDREPAGNADTNTGNMDPEQARGDDPKEDTDPSADRSENGADAGRQDAAPPRSDSGGNEGGDPGAAGAEGDEPGADGPGSEEEEGEEAGPEAEGESSHNNASQGAGDSGKAEQGDPPGSNAGGAEDGGGDGAGDPSPEGAGSRAEEEGSAAGGASENGSEQDKSREDRPGEDGTGEDRPAEGGAGRDGSGEDGSGEGGVEEDEAGREGAGQDGTGQDGSREDRPGADGKGEDGPAEDGAGQDGSGDDGSGEGGVEEDAAGREGVGQDGTDQDETDANGAETGDGGAASRNSGAQETMDDGGGVESGSGEYQRDSGDVEGQGAGAGGDVDAEAGAHHDGAGATDGETETMGAEPWGDAAGGASEGVEDWQLGAGSGAEGAELERGGPPPADVLSGIRETDQPLEGGMILDQPIFSDSSEMVDAARAATDPDADLAPEFSAGAPAQLFAEGGEVPDAVLLEIPPDHDETLPEMARPDPPRQILPAWINELVN